MIKFKCFCGQSIEVNEDAQGQEFKCPSCEEELTVPEIIHQKSPTVILPPLPSKLIDKKNQKIKHSNYVCKSCGTETNGDRTNDGSLAVLIVLLFCFVIPGIIYLLWMCSTDHRICHLCGGRDLVPFNSPIAQQIINA